MTEPVDIYDGQDVLELPMFALKDIAHWLDMRYGRLVRRVHETYCKISPDGLSFNRLRVMHIEYGGAGTFEGNVYYPALFVSINPRVSFGRPCVADTGINTAVIADRVASGEAAREVAEDYGIGLEAVMAAVEFEER